MCAPFIYIICGGGKQDNTRNQASRTLVRWTRRKTVLLLASLSRPVPKKNGLNAQLCMWKCGEINACVCLASLLFRPCVIALFCPPNGDSSSVPKKIFFRVLLVAKHLPDLGEDAVCLLARSVSSTGNGRQIGSATREKAKGPSSFVCVALAHSLSPFPIPRANPREGTLLEFSCTVCLPRPDHRTSTLPIT